MRFKIIIFFLSIPLVLPGQINESLRELKYLHQETEMAIRSISYPISTKKEHSLYLEKNWQNSCLLTNDDEFLYFNGRLNVLNQAVEAMLYDQVRNLRPIDVQLLSIGQQFFIPVQLKNTWTYFEILSEGKIYLLKKYYLTEKMEDQNSLVPGYTGEIFFYIESEYLFTKDFKSFKKIKPNRNKILPLLKDRSEEVEKFIDEYNINFKVERSLVKLFDFYNNLTD